ncbi:MAG: cupredoxin domain-containing protein [Chloroflexi bacterium]|nr:cupredoxin domain-containing protein [Chloroflexota bacterium]
MEVGNWLVPSLGFDRRQISIAAITGLLVLAALLIPLPLTTYQLQNHSITLNARTFAYEPATMRVQRGDTITLKLESLDAAHGLAIDGYPVDLRAEPGKSATITFVADREGKFALRCSVSCGALHPFMIGELIVEPELPRVRAMLVTLVTAFGAVMFFWSKT